MIEAGLVAIGFVIGFAAGFVAACLYWFGPWGP